MANTAGSHDIRTATRCEACERSLVGQPRFDARMASGWAFLCLTCFRAHGCRLGPGLGSAFGPDGKRLPTPAADRIDRIRSIMAIGVFRG